MCSEVLTKSAAPVRDVDDLMAQDAFLDDLLARGSSSFSPE